MDLNYVTTLARIEFTSSGAWKSCGEVEKPHSCGSSLYSVSITNAKLTNNNINIQ